MSRPITVQLTNRWARFRCSPEVQVRLKSFFRYHPPGYEYANSFRVGKWDGYTHMLRWGRVATGLFLFRLKRLRECGWKFHIQDQRGYPSILLKAKSSPDIRPYQEQAVQAMLRASNVGGLVLNSTGSGKTRITGEYFRRVAAVCVFVVDELTLLEQARRELTKAVGEDIGVIGEGECAPRRITVATIQSLAKLEKHPKLKQWIKLLEVIVLDEIHVALNERSFNAIQALQPKAVFGLTATLQVDTPHVGYPARALAGPVIFRYPLAQGVREGYLSPGVSCVVKVHGGASGFIREYSILYKALIVKSAVRNSCICALVAEGLRRGRRVIVVCEYLSHLNILSKLLEKFPHRVLSGKVSSRTDRFAAKEAMDAGELRLLLVSRIFGKGVDIRTVDTIIDTTASADASTVIQRYGRGTRKSESKHGLLHFDIHDVGNSFERAAKAREEALRRAKIPVIEAIWEEEDTTASDIYNQALQELKGRL